MLTGRLNNLDVLSQRVLGVLLVLHKAAILALAAVLRVLRRVDTPVVRVQRVDTRTTRVVILLARAVDTRGVIPAQRVDIQIALRVAILLALADTQGVTPVAAILVVIPAIIQVVLRAIQIAIRVAIPVVRVDTPHPIASHPLRLRRREVTKPRLRLLKLRLLRPLKVIVLQMLTYFWSSTVRLKASNAKV